MQTVTAGTSLPVHLLAFEQMTLNDGPYEGHKEAHKSNYILRKHKELMFMIYLFIIFGSRKQKNFLCN